METTAEPPFESKAPTPTTQPIIKYSPAEAEIAVLKEKYGALKADTPEGYDQVSRALREVVSTRTQIEARRKQLKEDSLSWGRQVDIAAKKLQALVAEVETPLRAEKDRVDAEKEAKARAIVEAEKARVADLERQVSEQEVARRKAVRDAEMAEMAERERKLAEERAKLEEINRKAREENERQAAAIQAERKAHEDAQAALNRERRKLAEEKERLDRIEFERVAREKAAEEARQEAARQAEIAEHNRQRREKEQLARAAEEKAEAARIEAAKPDMKKVREFGDYLNTMAVPEVQHQGAKEFLAFIRLEIRNIAIRCKDYTFKKGA